MFRSIRPAVLLALVVAVACTDQPTEPTSTEGSIRAALPPPPAEATVLTGTLGGGDGSGVSAELGYYDSPVYSTVTVSGALTYSGRPDGYLPGTGQIDAAGILLSSQCDLTVYISWALPTIGATTTIAPSCRYPAKNLGDYSRRMVLAGRIFTYRTYGPPLSCWKYPAPCVSYQGTQTVTVTPEEGNLIVTPDATVVGPGGEIGFTAKGVWAGDGKTVVPMTIREWRWQGSGREVGGGHTTICEPATSNPCYVQVYQSGTVTLEAIVNGKLKTQSVDIEVVGGGCSGATMPSEVHLAECQPEQDSLVIQVAIARPTALPLLVGYYFDAIGQTHFSKSTGSRVDINAPRPDTQSVTVTAHWKHSGLPAAGVNVQVSTEPIERSGGHIHTTGISRPTGSFFLKDENSQMRGRGPHYGSIGLVTDEEGKVVVTYRSSGIGGIEWVKASTQSGPAVVPRDSVGAVWRVPGLVELQPSSGDLYRFKPQFTSNPTMRHGDNNRWLQSHFGDSLQFVFGEFFAEGGVIDDPESGGAFFITDIGLEFGGLNDVGANGEWQGPHITHRTGLDIDIRSVRDENGRAAPVFSADDQSILHDVCYGTEELKWHPVIRCSFEPPPNGNPKHLHIEGWP